MESHDMEMIPMMMMLEQMDNLPEFYGSYSEMSELPSPQLSPGATTAPNIPHFMHTTSHDALPLPAFINQTTATGPTLPVSDTASSYPLSGASSMSLKRNSMAAMREMIFRIAAMQPIHIDPKSVKPPKRRNVRISSDPQSVAARHRRERISEKIRILQRLVPGGTKMDTASMLDEAIHYVKFLKSQVQSLEKVTVNQPPPVGLPVTMASGSYLPMPKEYSIGQNGQHLGDHTSFS